ncbi:Ig kappa chain V-III region Ti [Sciurus carolinensis]|uniref:Ig kappa chain V-III region Ti n=1 Tax=Sciurus carolinensis TaxID=30640 RepID=A0AA41SW38_SCICA|nr:Ig kappa chain V-III region Ti [Sciurus carolinensis]
MDKKGWGQPNQLWSSGNLSNMVRTLFFLFMLAYCPVKLTCTLSSGYSNYVVGWHQQSPGKSPRFVMRVGSSGMVGSKGEGIPDRFSGSGSGLDRYLTIQNIQEQDESVYYCGADHDSGSNYV